MPLGLGRFVVGDEAALQPVAFRQIGKGFVIAAQILLGLAEGEMQHRPIAGRQGFGPGGQGLGPGQEAVLRRHRAGHDAIEMGAGGAGRKAQGPVKGGDGFAAAARFFEGMAHEVPALRIARPALQDALQDGYRLQRPAHARAAGRPG